MAVVFILMVHGSYFIFDTIRGRGVSLYYFSFPLFLAAGYWAGLSYDKMAFLSEKDPLTGLYNRRKADARIPRMMAAADRTARKLFVLSIDCDNFKWINDSLNHQTGDAVLREIGSILLRESDKSRLAFRWGGDEFLLCGLCDDLNEVEQAKRRLKNHISQLSAEMGLPVQVSIGSAVYPDDNCTFAVLMNLADRNMYNEKKA